MMIEEEFQLQQKLTDLKRLAEAYEKALARVRAPSGPTASCFFSEMNDAERAYMALTDWFREQGYTIQWNVKRKQYEAIPVERQALPRMLC